MGVVRILAPTPTVGKSVCIVGVDDVECLETGDCATADKRRISLVQEPGSRPGPYSRRLPRWCESDFCAPATSTYPISSSSPFSRSVSARTLTARPLSHRRTSLQERDRETGASRIHTPSAQDAIRRHPSHTAAWPFQCSESFGPTSHLNQTYLHYPLGCLLALPSSWRPHLFQFTV